MKKIYVDYTITSASTANTGIQRVVKNIVRYFPEIAKDRNVEIILCAFDNYGIYKLPEKPRKVFKNRVVNKIYSKFIRKDRKYILSFSSKDVILLLDSTWNVEYWETLKYIRSKKAKIFHVVYDLIPIRFPQFCDESLQLMFKNWMYKLPDFCDAFIAISDTVKDDIKSFVNKELNITIKDEFFKSFNLGVDFINKQVSIDIENEIIKKIFDGNNTYLNISTIEPRKNQEYLLNCFEKLWEKNIDVCLCLIGKIGWKTENFVRRIKAHKEYNIKLFLVDNANDEDIVWAYKHAKAFLFPSYAEGYGLPIIESLYYNLKVFASDIDVHREIGGSRIEYFKLDKEINLVEKIIEYEINDLDINYENKSLNIKNLTWKESSIDLFNKIENIYENIV